MQYIDYNSNLHERAGREYMRLKQLFRVLFCGVLFAVPIAAMIPTSPLMRLSMTKNTQKAVMSRMMTDFFFVNFFASAVGYAVLVEPRLDKNVYGHKILPVLGPCSAQLPAACCLLFSHLFYPGAWAIINEMDHKTRRQVFLRLNLKCFFAFAPYHIPAAILLGCLGGCLLYPFKYFKHANAKPLKLESSP